MWSAGDFLLALFIIIISIWVYKWWNPKRRNVSLPPGSMGLPYIGETIQFCTPSKSIDTPAFLKSRIKKYGPIFKTRLLGRPFVITSDAEFNHSVLQQDGKLVEFWYLDTFSKAFDQAGMLKDCLGAGHVHKYIKKMVLEHVGHEFLRGRLFPNIHRTINRTLHSWTRQDSVDVKEALSRAISHFTANALFGYEAERYEDDISDLLSTVLKGLISIPLNIPGTPYRKCMQAKDKVMKMVKDTINQRRTSPETRREDFLDHLMDDMKKESFLTDDFIAYTVLGALIPAVEIVPINLTLAIKFISEHPLVMQEIMKENEQIFGGREDKEVSTWNDYKSMSFTTHVMNEALRITSSALIFRRVIQDIHVNGYTIPKGWAIVVISASLHMKADFYKDPLDFDPWRWKESQTSVTAKSFIPFGGGLRSCVGAEYAKVFMSMFIHGLVSKYRWTKVKGGEIVRNPSLIFKDGYHIKISEKLKD